jgi:hypothetical protein
MNRTGLVRCILNDLSTGKTHSAQGALDFYLHDCHVPAWRILILLERRFKIPFRVGVDTFIDLGVFGWHVH